jgi:hypothetical protein
MSNQTNHKISWADMEESDEDNVDIIDERDAKKIDSKILIIKQDDFDKNINLDTELLYSFVNIRVKNLSYIGLNNLENNSNHNNVKNFENVKVEIYYPLRKLKIFKLYRKIDKDMFETMYNIIKSTDDTNSKLDKINDMFQYYFLYNNTIYFPFIKVGNKYYDTVKYYEYNKTYELILYPIKL